MNLKLFLCHLYGSITSGVLELEDLMNKNRVWPEVGLDSNSMSLTYQLCEFQQGT